MAYMDLETAKTLALDLMQQHLAPFPSFASEWSFKFDRGLRRFGLCHFGRHEISLSKKLTLLNGVERVTNTILHEIAHANVGPRHGHDEVWRREAVRLGSDGKACVDPQKAVMPVGPWMGQCPGCKHAYPRWRRPLARPQSCGRCAPRRYDPRFQLQWSRTIIRDAEAYNQEQQQAAAAMAQSNRAGA